MFLESLSIKNLKLHTETEFDPGFGLNYFIGGNGEGKTTVLEAVYYLCTSKNLLQLNDSDAVRFNENFFDLRGRFNENSTNEVRVYYSADTKKKNIILNDKELQKSSELIGHFPVVTLTQSDLSITKGSPADRRKFTDSVLSQANKTYLEFLLEYQKILKNRAALLNQIRETRNYSLLDELTAWNENLIKCGTEIIKRRKVFICELNNYLKEVYVNLLKEKEKPDIIFKSIEFINDNELDEKYKMSLKQFKDEEIRKGINLIGPHRDDLQFSINGNDLKKFGSQGQNKTFQIALKFAQFFFLKDKIRKTPIFLMDDIFGELDTERSAKISSFMSSIGQAFITLTDFSKIENIAIEKSDKIFYMKNGKISYV